ncbi:MAG: hypothetical protein PHI44_05405 [Candidatus Ratteibacteria bacterium]|nr:hypothetical protein [Candidatus Ratteibacteria bacterium]
MLDKLIKKVVEDAEKKAEGLIEEAEKELEAMYLAEKMAIEKEYEEKLQTEKNRIDRNAERKISAFVMEKEKELLALKNGLIDEVMKKLEERFNEYLKENMKGLITSICKDIDKEKEYVVKIPAEADIYVDGIKIEKDNKLKNAFVIVAPEWDIVFNWESIKASIGDTLREKAASLLSQGNEEKRTS